MDRIAVIGTGYVGTVAGACLAEAGNSVVCVDADPGKVVALSSGSPVIHEPGLEVLLRKNLKSERIRFTTKIEEAVQASEIVFLTVGTPSGANGEADLRNLEAAATEVGKSLTRYKILVNKSTVPVGTHLKIREWAGKHAKAAFDVASNPEFLREGSAIQDFLKPERVVIGTLEDPVFERLRTLYLTVCLDPSRIVRMDPTSSELTKYACNAFLATKISFMNELSLLCDKTGADIESVKAGMSTDSRIGPQFLNAGIGYGGSCFPKDIRALLSVGAKHCLPLKIVNAVEAVNESQKLHLMSFVRKRFPQGLSGLTFAVWGLAFKPNTDDVREAPALPLIREIISAGGRIRAFDPVANENARQAIGEVSSIEFLSSAEEALRGSDSLIIATEWDEFRRADLGRIRKLLRTGTVFDGRNIFSPETAAANGIEYFSIGRVTAWVARSTHPRAAMDPTLRLAL